MYVTSPPAPPTLIIMNRYLPAYIHDEMVVKTMQESRGNFPIGYLIVLTSLLVAVFALLAPRPAAVIVVATPTSSEAAAPPQAVAIAQAQPTPEDHRMLMMLGLEQVNKSSVRLGQRVFSTSCASCHGFDAKGVPGLGKTLINSAFVDSLHNDALVAFITTGRTISDPANTTGVAMPGKGGNPSLTEKDLYAVVDYLRSLNGATVIDDIGAQPTSAEARPFTPINISALDPNAVAPSGGPSGSASVNELTQQAQSAATPQPLEDMGRSSGSMDGASGGGMGFSPINFNALDPNAVAPSGGASGSVDVSELAQQALNPATSTPEADPTTATPWPTTTPAPIQAPQSAAPVPDLDGQQVWVLACAGCHGGDGRGVSWIESSVLGALTMSDDDYFAMIVQRGDITVPGMHPGTMLISDDELRAAIAYMRTLGTGS